jgi:hypothetical protein
MVCRALRCAGTAAHLAAQLLALLGHLASLLDAALALRPPLPFVVCAALSQGRACALLVALLHGRGARELAEQAALVGQVCRVLSLLAQAPCTRRLLLAPTRFSDEELCMWQVLQDAARRTAAAAAAGGEGRCPGGPGRGSAGEWEDMQASAAWLAATVELVQVGGVGHEEMVLRGMLLLVGQAAGGGIA